MKYEKSNLKQITVIRTGKLDSNAAVPNGMYPFFTCDPTTLRINTWAYDTEAVLLAGNNASGNYTAKYYKGQFNAYQRTYIIESSDKEKLDVRYLAYAINQELKLLKTMSAGSTTKFLKIGMLHSLEISLPDISIQRKIASILGNYDDLIENNQKQIKLLEEGALRLYKEWFVDLHFPGYEDVEIVDGVPEGWKKIPICNFIEHEIGGGWGDENITQKCTKPAYVIRGTDIYGMNHGDFHYIPFRYHAESNLKSRILNDGDIVFEVSGGSKNEGVAKTFLLSSQLLEQFSSPIMCASFCKMIRPKEPFSQYLYDSFQYMRKSGKTTEYDKRSASSIVNYRWKDFLSKEYLLEPTEDILSRYNAIACSIYSSITTKSISIEKAKQARDRLLPKLMSGEIEV